MNNGFESIINGLASSIIMGRMGMEETQDLQAIRYIAPIIPGGHIQGYYKVVRANLKRVDDASYPIRIRFDVDDWTPLERPARFGLVKYAYRGVCKSRDEFFKHCEEQAVH